MGYDEKKIEKIGDHSDVDMETDPEVLARHEEIGNDRGFNVKGYQDQVRQITVYESYMMIDPEGTGVAELYRLVKAGNVLLEMEKTNHRPFVAFVPLPIPHAFFGNNFGSKVIPIQNARTVLTRSILDHTMITNNPRYMVVKGGLTNPKELIDNRVGGILNVTRPDAISPMPQASLNPFVFQTLQLLDEDKEDTTGVSRLSQGLNKDAISKQNSAAMVEQLATMSQQRQKIIARNFATGFLKPLYQMIYRLVIENEPEEKIVELAGDYVAVSPSQWGAKRDVTVENVADYLTPPDQLPPPEPDQAQEMAMQMQQKQLELQERQTQIAELKQQTDAQIAQLKLELEATKAERGFAIQSDSIDLKEAQLEHKTATDRAELEILRNAEDVRGIASPTG